MMIDDDIEMTEADTRLAPGVGFIIAAFAAIVLWTVAYGIYVALTR